VPLLSAPYFASEWCGREWDAFSRRLATARHGAARTPILPVVWAAPLADERIPAVARQVQRWAPHDPDLAARYATHGIFGLLHTDAASYEAVVWFLAMDIARAVYESATTPLISRPRDLRNVFAERP